VTNQGSVGDGRHRSILTAGVLRYYRISILVVAALIVSGLWSLVSLPRSEDPEFDIYDARIVVTYPGADPETVESLITRPIEDAVLEIDEVDTVQSSSTAGLSLLVITLRPDVTPADAVETIRKKVREIRPDLPDRINEPVVIGFNTSDIPAVLLALSGLDDLRSLDGMAERIRDTLLDLPGVARVDIDGMPERRILVDVNNERLAQLRIPLSRISDLLSLENAAIPGGTLDAGPTRYMLDNRNEYRDVEQIGDTVIGRFGDSLVLLRDVATVHDGTEEPHYLVRHDAAPALLLSVVKRKGDNTVAVCRRVGRALEDLGPTLPEDLSLTIINDRGASVSELLGGLGWNAIGGGLIVILVVSTFLGKREGFVVSVSIPLSVLLALTLMLLTGIDLNQVSIFGLVLALGMLVDSSLVVVENIGRHLESGEELRRAVIAGVDEVRSPVLASTLTTVAAFVPMLMLEGNMGAFIKGLPLAVIYALSGSLLVALTVIPLLCYTLWLRFPHTAEPDHESSKLLEGYTEVVKWALRHRPTTLVVAIVVFLLSLATIPVLGLQLFPKAEKSFFFINIRLPGGANLDATDAVTTQVEETLRNRAGVRNFTTNIGKGNPLVYYNVTREGRKTNFAQIYVNLDRGSAESFVTELEPELDKIAGASVEVKVIEQGPVGAAPIQIRVMGPELNTLAEIARTVRGRISEVPGLSDLRDSLGETTPRLVLELDRHETALLGVDGFSIAQTVLTALNGNEATPLRTDDDEVPIVVRLDRASLGEISSLDRLYLPTREGAVVPFSEVVRIREDRGWAEITRRGGRRAVVITAEVSRRLPSEALAEIRELIADMALPDGYSIEYGGEHEERQKAFAGLWEAMLLALLLIYALLAIQFNSFVQPLVILFTVPLGLTGAIFGLLITGNPFGMMAFIGVISLTGIIINDSIVLTDFANYLQRVEGRGRLAALIEAGRLRFRPVIATSITTIGGLTPLAIWGGNLWAPLACAIIFGLLGATVLILVVLPVIYSVLVGAAEGSREFRAWEIIRDRLVRG
jgi:multidrug efflux pump subunit AcrB